ncbi:aminotransferase class IV [Asaia lannensis]|uniref:aminotransferase class IV n=1 Tax=Asaia lannensis TaxID=415421 RepID=UPI001C99C4F3
MNFVWHNASLVEAGSVRIDPTDRGFLLGDGLFETMRLEKGRILRLEAHLRRLAEGASLLQIPLPDTNLLRDALHEVSSANGAMQAALRLTLTRGVGPRGLLPPAMPETTLLITQAALPAPSGPCRLHFSRYRRDGASPLSRIKHLNYLPQILARMEADKAGYDDALLMSADGCHIAEASAATLIVSDGETLLTPPLDNGALAGTARAALLESGWGIERRLTPDDLRNAQAAWLINSLSVRAISRIGAHPLPQDAQCQARIERLLFCAPD